jgi:soluble lytic murein transglycosylase-like protein
MLGMTALSLVAFGVAAGAGVPLPAARPQIEALASATPSSARRPVTRADIRAILEQEARKAGLPTDIAEAVVRVESSFDPTTIGGVGEIGLMQVRPGTAAMLGFRGNATELARPEINIHYGVTYLGKAWRLANGDLCRALMKYRAGHGEEVMSPLSVTYCNRARSHLATLGSPFAMGATAPIEPSLDSYPSRSIKASLRGSAKVKRGGSAASRAFWSAHEARVQAITARLRAKWRRVASR